MKIVLQVSIYLTPVNGKKVSTLFSTSLRGISALVVTLSSQFQWTLQISCFL